MHAKSQKVLILFVFLGTIAKVTGDIENFDFYKTFKTPKENHDETCAKLDQMEILERSSFLDEDEKEEVDVKKANDVKNAASAHVNVRFGNNIHNNNKPGLELGHSVHYNFYMCGNPFHHMTPYSCHHYLPAPWNYVNSPTCYPNYFSSNVIPNANPSFPIQIPSSLTSTPAAPSVNDDHEISKKLAKFIETYQRENKIAASKELQTTTESSTIPSESEDCDSKVNANYKRLASLSDGDLELLLKIFDEDYKNVTEERQSIKPHHKRSVAFRAPDIFIENILQEAPCAEIYRPIHDDLIISDSLIFLDNNMNKIRDAGCDCFNDKESTEDEYERTPIKEF